MFTLEAGIADTIDTLKEKLSKADEGHELAKYKQVRLVHTIVSSPAL